MTEWNHDAELDWALVGQPFHDGVTRLIKDLNGLYRTERALHQSDMMSEGFRWISCDDWANSVYCYLRSAIDRNDFLVIIANFTPVPRHNYKVGVPAAGFYSELLNTDADCYGGSSVGNAGGVYSQAGSFHGQAQHLSLTVPPLGMLVLKPVLGTPANR